MKNWKLVAEAYGHGVSGAELERILPSLESLDAEFRKVLNSLPSDAESAAIFEADLGAK
jgi:hypothetical protein